ncbi:MBL fold metallo-hydrolase [bacterium]|nr:MBL fold metallo-hydrolase [bacterium]
MSKITFLGTASAVPSQNQHNSHFVLEAEDHVVMVDSPGNPIVRLEEAGLDPQSITDLVLTHFHPDHVSGVPLLLMDLWLMGREAPLAIYGMADLIDRVEQMMALFEWETWEGFYPVEFHRLVTEDKTSLLETESLSAWAYPVCHMIPAIGLRFELPEAVVGYSTDTEPCDQVVQLAEDADILIHEATGSSYGHSGAAEAGEVAEKAGVRTLVLTHYPVDADREALLSKAQSTFSGDVIVAEDLMQLLIS